MKDTKKNEIRKYCSFVSVCDFIIAFLEVILTAGLVLGVSFCEMFLLIPSGIRGIWGTVLGCFGILIEIGNVYIILMGAAKLWDPVHGKKNRYAGSMILMNLYFFEDLVRGVIMISLGFKNLIIWVIYYILLGTLWILNITAFLIKQKEKKKNVEKQQTEHRKTADRHVGILAETGQYADSIFWMKNGEHRLIFGCDSRKCQILFKDRHISRVHCIVRYDEKEDVYTITDYSSNGTYLQNGKRLLYREPYVCRTGTCFRITQNEIFRLL